MKGIEERRGGCTNKVNFGTSCSTSLKEYIFHFLYIMLCFPQTFQYTSKNTYFICMSNGQNGVCRAFLCEIYTIWNFSGLYKRSNNMNNFVCNSLRGLFGARSNMMGSIYLCILCNRRMKFFRARRWFIFENIKTCIELFLFYKF